MTANLLVIIVAEVYMKFEFNVYILYMLYTYMYRSC